MKIKELLVALQSLPHSKWTDDLSLKDAIEYYKNISGDQEAHDLETGSDHLARDFDWLIREPNEAERQRLVKRLKATIISILLCEQNKFLILY